MEVKLCAIKMEKYENKKVTNNNNDKTQQEESY